uniref:CSON003978 protein n=1 Tax=Culicoides sonorensis TaxID=179676 RepID=A0A336MSG1_CULSO
MFCAVRGFIRKLENFQLEFEVPSGEKFDDIVFFESRREIMAVLFTNVGIDVDENDQLKVERRELWLTEIDSIKLKEIDLDRNYILNNKKKYPESKFYKFTEDENIVKILIKQANELYFNKNNHNDKKLKAETVDKTYFTENDIQEALEHIVYAVSQPNDEGLVKIIKNDIKNRFGYQDVENIYNKFKDSMQNWCERKENPFADPINFDDIEKFFELDLKQITFNVTKPIDSFIGREEKLEEIKNVLLAKSNSIFDYMVVVVGLGGIGKTQLVKKFIDLHQKDLFYGRIVWINAENDSSLNHSFRRLAQKLYLKDFKEKDIKTIIEDTLDFFDDVKVLFVFDNYDGQEHNHQKYVTFCCDHAATKENRPYFVFTSRNQKCLPKIKKIHLTEFTEPEAVKLIKQQLKTINGFIMIEKDIIALGKVLQYYPLTIHQAISFIKNKRNMAGSQTFNVKKYLEIFRNKKNQILQMVALINNVSLSSQKTNYSAVHEYKELFTIIQEKAFQITTLNENNLESLKISDIFMNQLTLAQFFSLVETNSKTIVEKYIDNYFAENDSEHKLNWFFVEFAKRGKLYWVKYMIEKGYDVNFVDENGNTALHHIAYIIKQCRSTDIFLSSDFYNFAHVSSWLKKNGANYNIKNKKGHTPLDISDKFRLTLITFSTASGNLTFPSIKASIQSA